MPAAAAVRNGREIRGLTLGVDAAVPGGTDGAKRLTLGLARIERMRRWPARGWARPDGANVAWRDENGNEVDVKPFELRP